MRNIVWSFSMFFCFVFSGFSQTKGIEKGTYLSVSKTDRIKLNLLDNNKYELVFYSGNYEIKGDSLLFSKEKKSGSVFDLDFKREKNAKKIKIKFLEPSYFTFYIGTQNGSEPIQYQKLADIQGRQKSDPDQLDTVFEVDRADYLYVVYEGYYQEGTKISKYALPKDVSEVTIKYAPDLLGDLILSGFLDPKTNELRISDQGGKSPLVFMNEKEIQADKNQKVTALENQQVSKFTYPGKEDLIKDDFGSDPAVDSTTVVEAYTPNKVDFKLKVENSLKTAVASTKSSASKFLVVYTDTKNPSAKTDFDDFIKNQESQIGYNMYETYDPQYDIYNFYFAGAEDKKWLKTNKISDNPSVIILNGDGDVLATVKSTLNDQKEKFYYYDDFYKKLQRSNALYGFNKTVKNKKATDADLISAFNKAAIIELPYNYDSEYTVDKVEDPTDFKIIKITLDKKEVNQIWKKLIEAHQKDSQPNILLVQTILKEIKNQGFYKQFFNEDRILNDTDFLAIDYLIKHYDAIEKADNAAPIDSITPKIGDLSAEISSALQLNSYVTQEGVQGNANQNKIVSIYKKLISKGKGGFDCYKNYFAYLAQESETSGNYSEYLKEFNAYFEANLSPEKGNPIQKLDEIFAGLDSSNEYSYDGWASFKDYHSNISNSAAWTVVLKPENANYLKQAIQWSEYSLMVTRNNPYYLDTLAQLYYKDGQKQKAVETQTAAVKFLSDTVEEQTASEIRETLTKMQNGTY